MYIYDRLIILGQLPGANNHTNAMIARWLLAHLSTLSGMDEMQCMKEACVSKASIHRFYSCAGFHSFAQMISSLQKEKQTFRFYAPGREKGSWSKTEMQNFGKDLQRASRVVLYGCLYDLSCLQELFFDLYQHGRQPVLAVAWDQSQIIQEIEALEENDVFVYVDTSIKLQNAYENSMDYSYLPSLVTVTNHACRKWFLGKQSDSQYMEFHTLTVREDNLLTLQKEVCSLL